MVCELLWQGRLYQLVGERRCGFLHYTVKGLSLASFNEPPKTTGAFFWRKKSLSLNFAHTSYGMATGSCLGHHTALS